MDSLIKVLEKTVSSNQADQNEAVVYIQKFCNEDFIGFIQALSDVLYDQQNQPVVRAAAGLQLKNQLTSRDEHVRQKQQDRWRTLPESSRAHIKDRVFKALGTEIFRPLLAPQCVAYIAIAELNEKQWPEFIGALVENARGPTTNDKLRLATLEAIGYICQEIVASEHQQNSRKREITNGLNASMTTIYSYIGQCVSSQNYELMTTSLQCLSGLMSWAQVNQDLMRFLCQLLRKCEMKPVQVPNESSDEKLAIINSTCDCLNVCLERKHSKTDSFEVRTSIYEDENNLRAIISTLDDLNRLPIQQDTQAHLDAMKKLSQVITNILRYVYICHPEKPQHLQDMYSIMKVIIDHPSITVNAESIKFWNKVFALAPKKPNPSINDELTASLLIVCANKLVRAKYDCKLYGYEFDCQQDLDQFQGKYRGEICELCRNLTSQNDRICFELVCNSIAKSAQQRNIDLSEWDALAFLSSAVCSKLKDPSMYLINGVELIKVLSIYMDSTLQQASVIPPDATGSEASLIPDLISTQLSCLSALYVFLPYWHQNDKELTKDLMRKVILFAFHRPDKFIESSRQLVGNNTHLLKNESFLRGFRGLSRHASAHFVRTCMDYSKHLLDIFDFLKSSIDYLFSIVVDNPYSTEKCQLYEGLTLICNENSDDGMKKKFVLELFETISWFKDYELTCDQFIDFVGLNRFEAEQDGLDAQNLISQPVPTAQLNRVKLSYVINFIGAITKRLTSRAALLPEILSFARPVLNLLFTMHAIWLPEMKVKCVKEYQPFLFAPFNSSYKQHILETILVQNSTNSSDTTTPTGSSTFGDVPNRPSKGSSGQYIEIFSWNFYEALLTTMGTIINKTSPELFSYIDVIHLQTALTGAEYLPSLKLHKLIKHFIMPLVNNCSKDQKLIETQLLPLLSKLLPFLFEALDGQWGKIAKEEENPSNGISDGKLDQTQVLADEMVQDQLLRNLSRDFIDLMNLILIESVPASSETNVHNNSGTFLATTHQQSNTTNSRQNQQDLHKIGMLGLNLLAGGPDFVMKVMASTLTWSDSTLNFKTIFINQQLVKHILASNVIKSVDEAPVWFGCMIGNVITSLRMFGEHEQNCSGLLTLFLTLYENLNKVIPNFHEHLEQMTGIPRSTFMKYDHDTLKSNEKSKRASLRKVLDSLVGQKVNMIMR
uniref:Importin subunit beta n=1 Tax=Aceria tosichella TaxID=561515 RepID=A0A6G1SFT6_9ACAR